tara:strand:+ start:682 stop:1029 length:348 start_codon:yes stop_codon:yes gene_type:complete
MVMLESLVGYPWDEGWMVLFLFGDGDHWILSFRGMQTWLEGSRKELEGSVGPGTMVGYLSILEFGGQRCSPELVVPALGSIPLRQTCQYHRRHYLVRQLMSLLILLPIPNPVSPY